MRHGLQAIMRDLPGKIFTGKYPKQFGNYHRFAIQDLSRI